MASPLKGKDKYYFEAFKEEGQPIGKSEEINFIQCKHKTIKYENGVLRCQCGAAWGGERLGELEKLLKDRVV